VLYLWLPGSVHRVLEQSGRQLLPRRLAGLTLILVGAALCWHLARG
jgi:hypothetical protein